MVSLPLRGGIYVVLRYKKSLSGFLRSAPCPRWTHLPAYLPGQHRGVPDVGAHVDDQALGTFIVTVLFAPGVYVRKHETCTIFPAESTDISSTLLNMRGNTTVLVTKYYVVVVTAS